MFIGGLSGSLVLRLLGPLPVLVHTLPPPGWEPAPAAVGGLALAPDGRLFVTAGGLWEFLPDRDGWVHRPAPAAGPVAVDAAGRVVAWALADGRIAVDRLGGAHVATVAHPWTSPHAPARVRFSPDGAELWAEYDRRVRWSTATWRELPPSDTVVAPTRDTSADGRLVAEWNYPAARLAVRADGVLVVRVPTQDRPAITTAVFTPDGRLLLAAQKGRVRRFDLATALELPTLHWRCGRVTALAVAPDGLTAAAGTATGRVVVWDL